MKSTKEIPLTSVLNFHRDLKGVISDPEHRTLVRKAVGSGITITESGVDILITTQDCDRDGDVIITSGVDTTFYNECLAWNHDLDLPTIGRVVDLKRGPASLTGTAIFASEMEFAKDIEYLVRNGFLKGVSLGFIPVPSGVVTRGSTSFKSLCATYGIDAAKCKRIITRCELVEVSIVPVGANPHCGVISGMKSVMGKSLALKLESKSIDDAVPESTSDKVARLELMLMDMQAALSAITAPVEVTLESTDEPTPMQEPSEPTEAVIEPVEVTEPVEAQPDAVATPGTSDTDVTSATDEGPAQPEPTPETEVEAVDTVAEAYLEAKAIDAVSSTEVISGTDEVPATDVTSATDEGPATQGPAKPKPFKVIRLGGPVVTPDIQYKALRYAQGKSF